MTERSRIRRPPLERSGAIRNWATLFGVPMGSTAGGNGESVWGMRDDAPGGEARAGGAVEDVVARSVGLGYRVIDEYIQQGERVARSFGDRSYGTATMVNDAQGVATRMTQYATEMTSLWFEFAGLAMRGSGFPMAPFGAPPSPGQGSAPTPPTPASHAGAAPPPPATRFRVAVASSRPAEAIVDLRLAGATPPIVASALRMATGEGTLRITDVVVDAAEADVPLTVRIRVAADQPAGEYEGTLVDDAGRSVGWITLRVGTP